MAEKGIVEAFRVYLESLDELARAKARAEHEWTGRPEACLRRPECRSRQSCDVSESGHEQAR